MHPEGPAAVWAESLEGKKNKNENYLSSAKIKTGAFINLWWVLTLKLFQSGFWSWLRPWLDHILRNMCPPPLKSFSLIQCCGQGCDSCVRIPPWNSITLDWWGAQIRPQMKRRAVLIRCGCYTVAFYKRPRPLHSDWLKSDHMHNSTGASWVGEIGGENEGEMIDKMVC